jgi:transcriptional regulator with XRE-family HTH domain
VATGDRRCAVSAPSCWSWAKRLVVFRERYGLTQMEVARAIGAGTASTATLWESGVNVPDGMLRERLGDLLAGRGWPELRAVMIADADDGLPHSWDRALHHETMNNSSARGAADPRHPRPDLGTRRTRPLRIRGGS